MKQSLNFILPILVGVAILALYRIRTDSKNPLVPTGGIPRVSENVPQAILDKVKLAPAAFDPRTTPEPPATHMSGTSSVAPKLEASLEVNTDIPGRELFSGRVPGYPKLEPATEKVLGHVRELVAKNQPEAALQELERELQSAKTNQFLLLEAATMQYQLMGDQNKAEFYLRNILAHHPESKLGAAALGDFLAHQGRNKEAQPLLLRAADNSEIPEAHVQLGNNQLNQRDFDGAVNSFERAYQSVATEIENKASSESTLLLRQKLAQIGMHRGFALAENNRFTEAWEMAKRAEATLGSQNINLIELKKRISQRQRSAETATDTASPQVSPAE